MDIQENIINKVANSGLVTFDLASLKNKSHLVGFDIKDNLYQGLILREKEFREFLKNNDWSVYKGKIVLLHCSVDAIVPTWAYMLLANQLQPFAADVIFGDTDYADSLLFDKALNELNYEQFRDQRVVVKGCGDIKIPESAFVRFTMELGKVAKSIMYGEPCSTVPIFKRKA